MTLDEVRKSIDALDPQIRELILRRMDCSEQVAQAKMQANETNIYRADREAAILERLGSGVPEDRRAEYLSVVRKIMQASRMYQYGLMYDWTDGAAASECFEGLEICEGCGSVRVLMTCANRPNALADILSMIGDYSCNLLSLNTTASDAHTASFELEIEGDLNTVSMKKLMFQLSHETGNFRILGTKQAQGR